MKRSKYLGELEQMIMLAVLQLGQEAYGTNVMDELGKRADRQVSRGALYVTLDRLEEKGMIASTVGDPTPGRGGRPKRYLEVTRTGLAELRRSRIAWMQLWDGLESMLEQK